MLYCVLYQQLAGRAPPILGNITSRVSEVSKHKAASEVFLSTAGWRSAPNVLDSARGALPLKYARKVTL